MITVACVYWKGSFKGREKFYTEEWVRKLKRMVARNLSEPHRFVCLSNVTIDGVETIPLKHNWPGWWSKMELFRPGLFKGRVLFLDLDLVVMSSLLPFFETKGDFVITGKILGNGLVRPGEVTNYQSCTMVWDADCKISIALYKTFEMDVKRYMQAFRGDQDFIGAMVPGLPKFNPKWVTKLRFCPGKGETPDRNAIIINCMPYKNNIASKKFNWVKAIWN